MKRSVWKWLCVISSILLVLTILLTVFLLALANTAASMAGFFFEQTGSEDIVYTPLGLREYITHYFVGTLPFHVCVIAGMVLIGSIVALVVTRKRKAVQPVSMIGEAPQ